MSLKVFIGMWNGEAGVGGSRGVKVLHCGHRGVILVQMGDCVCRKTVLPYRSDTAAALTVKVTEEQKELVYQTLPYEYHTYV